MGTTRKPKQPLAIPVSDDVLIALRKIIQSIELNSKSLVKRVGLTGPQLMILQEVSKTGDVSVGEIAKAISLSQGTVTGIVERMEKRGLLERYRSTIDRRRVIVHVTETGEALLLNAPPLMQESFVDQFNRLHKWEQYMILSALQLLVSIMNARDLKAGPFLATGPIGEMQKKEPDGSPSAVV